MVQEGFIRDSWFLFYPGFFWNISFDEFSTEGRGGEFRIRKLLNWELDAISSEEIMENIYQDEVQESTIIHINPTSHIPRATDNKITFTSINPQCVFF